MDASSPLGVKFVFSMSLSKQSKYVLAYASAALIAFSLLTLQGCTGKSSADGPAAKDGGGGRGRGGRGGRGRGDGGPVPVVVATVSQRDVPITVDVIGNVEAYSTISVKAQVGGQLVQVHFQEGDTVKKDDLLFSIDPRPLQGQLNQAQANLSQVTANLARDTAALGQTQANLARDTANQKYALTQAERMQKLFEQGVVSKEQTDQIASQRGCAGANHSSGPSRHRKRARPDRRHQSGGAERPVVGRKRQGPVGLHQHSVAHRRTHRQSVGEAGQPGDGQYAGIGDHRAGASDLRHLLGSGIAVGRHQESTWPKASCRSPHDRRTKPARRKSAF